MESLVAAEASSDSLVSEEVFLAGVAGVGTADLLGRALSVHEVAAAPHPALEYVLLINSCVLALLAALNPYKTVLAHKFVKDLRLALWLAFILLGLPVEVRFILLLLFETEVFEDHFCGARRVEIGPAVLAGYLGAVEFAGFAD